MEKDPAGIDVCCSSNLHFCVCVSKCTEWTKLHMNVGSGYWDFVLVFQIFFLHFPLIYEPYEHKQLTIVKPPTTTNPTEKLLKSGWIGVTLNPFDTMLDDVVQKNSDPVRIYVVLTQQENDIQHVPPPAHCSRCCCPTSSSVLWKCLGRGSGAGLVHGQTQSTTWVHKHTYAHKFTIIYIKKCMAMLLVPEKFSWKH